MCVKNINHVFKSTMKQNNDLSCICLIMMEIGSTVAPCNTLYDQKWVIFQKNLFKVHQHLVGGDGCALNYVYRLYLTGTW